MTKKKENPIEVVLENENILPEAPASINIKLNWDGGDGMLTMRDFDEYSLLDRLVKFLPGLSVYGIEIAGRAAPKKAKGTPKKAEPEGIIDEATIEVTTIYVKQGDRGNYAFVKGTPGFEKNGAFCGDDAWEGTGYSLQEQAPDKFYDGADFGFVRAVLRIDGGKARVWKFLTSHEQIAF